jgi:large subunit ribosomal protein L29
MSADAVELRALTDAQLQAQLNETHQALFNLRFQAATRQLADVAEVRQARRRIARIKTLLRERELLAEIDAAAASQNGN